MTANPLRREVLKSFKDLHRAADYVFRNDQNALDAARREINKAYKKNINVFNEDSIREFIKFAHDVRIELITTVVELEPTEGGNFKMHLRPEVFEEHNNVPLKKQPK